MKRTIAILLQPSTQQAALLRCLQREYSAASATASRIAFQARESNRVRLHHLAYYRLRLLHPNLGAQMACNVIAAVSQSIKAYRANGREWTPLTLRDDCSVHLDARTYRLLSDTVSIFTMKGRAIIPFVTGAFQRGLLTRGIIREANLCLRDGRWYLHVVLDLQSAAHHGGDAVLGVDLGESVAAATSIGTLYGGGNLRNTRDRFFALRKRLQCNGSQSAKQLLARVSGRESRHVRHVNHVISARIVREAQTHGCGTIVLENLTNIRTRIRMSRRMRTRLHRWAWRQLQAFITYKAEAAGIAVIYVNPAYTSRTCSQCGVLGTRRKHRFFCTACGIFAHSDRNAARNLAKIGVSALTPTGDVMRPGVAA